MSCLEFWGQKTNDFHFGIRLSTSTKCGKSDKSSPNALVIYCCCFFFFFRPRRSWGSASLCSIGNRKPRDSFWEKLATPTYVHTHTHANAQPLCKSFFRASGLSCVSVWNTQHMCYPETTLCGVFVTCMLFVWCCVFFVVFFFVSTTTCRGWVTLWTRRRVTTPSVSNTPWSSTNSWPGWKSHTRFWSN